MRKIIVILLIIGIVAPCFAGEREKTLNRGYAYLGAGIAGILTFSTVGTPYIAFSTCYFLYQAHKNMKEAIQEDKNEVDNRA